MNIYDLVEVETPKEERQFLEVHILLNRHDQNWIRPLDKDVLEVFNPQKNKFYRHGLSKRWLLFDEKRKLIGRIAAFVNDHYKNKDDEGPVGGIGFFDCIDDQEAANLLFDQAKEWLLEQGMTAMDGPINFGERDKFWGLLIEGFEPPLYGMNYNQPYYQKLFENYGFKLFYNQLCFNLKIEEEPGQLEKKFYDAHSKFSVDDDFAVRNITRKNLRQSATDFSIIYNKAWAGHGGNKTISAEKAYKIFKSMKPVMNDYLGWLTYHKGQPVALWVNMPDLNQIFKHVHGKLNLLCKVKFLYHQKFGKNDKFVGIVFGVVPEFHGSGIDYYMIVEAEKAIKKHTNYRHLELQWIGEFNPKMVGVARNLGSVVSRKLATYRYLFDREAEFKPHPIL